MLFKRPKTECKFKLYEEYIPVILDVENTKDRDLSDYEAVWYEILLDPIYFWYLMMILELYEEDEETIEFSLSRIGEIGNYAKTVNSNDNKVIENNDLKDWDIWWGTYDMILFRLIYLSGAFLAFDIKSIELIGTASEIAKDIMKKSLVSGGEKSDIELEWIYYILWVLRWIEDKQFDKYYKVRSVHDYKKAKENSLSTLDSYTIFSKITWDNRDKNDFWEIISFLWEYMKVTLEVDKKNMGQLREFIDTSVEDIMDMSLDIHFLLRKFIKIAKESEIIGWTVFIPFSKCIEADFPLLQFIYYLQKNEWGHLISWNIEGDVWAIWIGDPIISRALGIKGSDDDKIDTSELIYNETKELLYFKKKPLHLGEMNETFVKEFFDLSFDQDAGLSIEELVERLEPNIESFTPEKIKQAKKRLSYDRVDLLNIKITKLTWLPKCFKVINSKIKLLFQISVEK